MSDPDEDAEVKAILAKIDYWMEPLATPVKITIDGKPVEWKYRGISHGSLGLSKYWYIESSPEDIAVLDFIEARDGMRIWGTIGGAFGG